MFLKAIFLRDPETSVVRSKRSQYMSNLYSLQEWRASLCVWKERKDMFSCHPLNIKKNNPK